MITNKSCTDIEEGIKGVVLVVDDNLANLSLLTKLLTHKGVNQL